MAAKTCEASEKKYCELDAIINKYKGQEGMVIRILQQAQNLFGYLPREVQSHISDKLDIPISTINGIVSFYSLFSEKAQGKYIVEVCMGTACYVKGAQEVLNALKEEIKIDEGETSLDGLFTLKATRCIGACGLAPVMTINEEVYGRLTPDDIPGILRKYIKSHKETSKSR